MTMDTYAYAMIQVTHFNPLNSFQYTKLMLGFRHEYTGRLDGTHDLPADYGELLCLDLQRDLGVHRCLRGGELDSRRGGYQIRPDPR